MRVVVYSLRSEDNFWESIFTYHHVEALGFELKSSGMVASTGHVVVSIFTLRAVLTFTFMAPLSR